MMESEKMKTRRTTTFKISYTHERFLTKKLCLKALFLVGLRGILFSEFCDVFVGDLAAERLIYEQVDVDVESVEVLELRHDDIEALADQLVAVHLEQRDGGAKDELEPLAEEDVHDSNDEAKRQRVREQRAIPMRRIQTSNNHLRSINKKLFIR